MCHSTTNHYLSCSCYTNPEFHPCPRSPDGQTPCTSALNSRNVASVEREYSGACPRHSDRADGAPRWRILSGSETYTVEIKKTKFNEGPESEVAGAPRAQGSGEESSACKMSAVNEGDAVAVAGDGGEGGRHARSAGEERSHKKKHGRHVLVKKDLKRRYVVGERDISYTRNKRSGEESRITSKCVIL